MNSVIFIFYKFIYLWLGGGTKGQLNESEIEFFQQLIDTYLFPIPKDEEKEGLYKIVISRHKFGGKVVYLHLINKVHKA